MRLGGVNSLTACAEAPSVLGVSLVNVIHRNNNGALRPPPDSASSLNITYGLCRSCHTSGGGGPAKMQQPDDSRFFFNRGKKKKKIGGAWRGGAGRSPPLRPACHPLCSSQAAAEPVTLGSVHHPLHSAWRPPARGLTFPEVQSHSASCYSL